MTECRVGLKGGTQEQEEWCNIIETLLASTNQLCIHQKMYTEDKCKRVWKSLQVTTKYGPNKVWLEAYSAATNSVIQ